MGQCVLETFVLRAVENDLAQILAIEHCEAKRDIVPRSKLVQQPTHAIDLITRRVLVARHDVQWCIDVWNRTWIGYGSREGAMRLNAVAMRDVARIRRSLPRALLALTNAFQLLGHLVYQSGSKD